MLRIRNTRLNKPEVLCRLPLHVHSELLATRTPDKEIGYHRCIPKGKRHKIASACKLCSCKELSCPLGSISWPCIACGTSPPGTFHGLGRDHLLACCESVERKLLKLNLLTRIIYIDANQATLCVVVEYNTFRNLPALRTRLLR
jgi:hypothetical protein